jgi:7-alpha-hydroxysteroid dehydrogenase
MAAQSMSSFSLEGRVALVTGGGRGIGEAIARRFAEAGAAVAVTARTAAEIERVAADIQAAGGRAFAWPTDVNRIDRLPELVDNTVAALGGLDILVNNAGGGDEWRPFLETTVEQLEAAFHFNVSVAFELARLSVPHMLERPGASIINMSSIALYKSARGHIAYDAAKGALHIITKSMAADLGPRIRVNAIMPGATETPALRELLDTRAPDMREKLIERTRLHRNATPEDIANAAVFLASPAASFITGKYLELDGGPVDEISQRFPDL